MAARPRGAAAGTGSGTGTSGRRPRVDSSRAEQKQQRRSGKKVLAHNSVALSPIAQSEESDSARSREGEFDLQVPAGTGTRRQEGGERGAGASAPRDKTRSTVGREASGEDNAVMLPALAQQQGNGNVRRESSGSVKKKKNRAKTREASPSAGDGVRDGNSNLGDPPGMATAAANTVGNGPVTASPATSSASVTPTSSASASPAVWSDKTPPNSGRKGENRAMGKMVSRLRRKRSGLKSTLEEAEIDEAVREHADNPFFVQIFNAIAEETSIGCTISGRVLLKVLEDEGLQRNDSRLKEFRKRLEDQGGSGARLDRLHFCYVIWPCESLISAALTHRLIIPDFPAFAELLGSIFGNIRSNRAGHNATYIPPLAETDPEHYAMAVCTIDGQIAVYGDSDVPFSVQSCGAPLIYALAVTQHGLEKVHHHIGREPSGGKFNAMVLKPVEEDEIDRETVARGGHARTAIPHNPLVNAGALMACSLIEPTSTAGAGACIQSLVNMWEKLTNSKSQVNACVFASEREVSDRNYCLLYMMKEAHALPKTNQDVHRIMELYLQACSIEQSTRNMAVMAATLAKGGVNPFSGERIFDPEAVRSCLSLMLSCGMYDYSGEWAFHVGLPAKSGVGGAVFAVLPNIGGICVWSPRLGSAGNSVRAVEFFKRMVREVAVHQFDSLALGGKMNLTGGQDNDELMATELVFAAARGDLDSMRSLLARGVDVNCENYDRRTPLHVAACSGDAVAVRFLLNNGADLHAKDRWGITPIVEAAREQHQDVTIVFRAALDGTLKVSPQNVVQPLQRARSTGRGIGRQGMSVARHRWFWAVRKVIVLKTVERVTARLNQIPEMAQWLREIEERCKSENLVAVSMLG